MGSTFRLSRSRMIMLMNATSDVGDLQCFSDWCEDFLSQDGDYFDFSVNTHLRQKIRMINKKQYFKKIASIMDQQEFIL